LDSGKLGLASIGGAAIGTLGGLIGLGGAEFRLPLLIGVFRFAALEAVILNKALSLVVVGTALPFRATTVPLSALLDHWTTIANLLAGSVVGAWFGAGWATRLRSKTLYKVISVLLVLIALVLLFGHDVAGRSPVAGKAQVIGGVVAGFLIGVVASLLGVAGGELLMPTLVLLFGADIKLAGSLSLAVSLPTMLVGFARYSQDRNFVVIAHNRPFFVAMALGSILGSFIGGELLLGVVPSWIILPGLALVLIVSGFRMWRHGRN
jgi:uncharacterized membrane protein YfcA